MFSHDSHNIIAISFIASDKNPPQKKKKKKKAGITVVKNGKVQDTLQLKIAGIMSDDLPYDIVKKYILCMNLPTMNLMLKKKKKKS
ncbi:adenine deaminase C-terminal domain-containing protein [Brachyspira hyodysenteriae]|uniref:adenine deaminase C-terminal domain-containing protein n=1 Tax=Brachyspira hyodysenteriae TaxID=159 RepID=UPI0022CDF5D2|nr:hypothetical protein [Brachyspira hyodysenteriae]